MPAIHAAAKYNRERECVRVSSFYSLLLHDDCSLAGLV